MTFFGYDVPVPIWLEKQFVRYNISPQLLELFAETNAETIPYHIVKMPYPAMFVETKDQVSPDVMICGMLAMYLDDGEVEDINDLLESGDREKIPNGGGYRIRPIYRIRGQIWCPVEFAVNKNGDTIDDVKVDWNTMTENADDIGLYEEHPLVKRASYYCWMTLAMTCIYVTCNDADVILGIETKEYRKISRKKKPKQSKLNQLRNTRYLGRNIKINRKIIVRNLPDKGGTHASPIPHWRSGHFRHLASGKVVWVRPCIIGYGKEKRIPLLKKYLVE